jgi:hypothetical protein
MSYAFNYIRLDRRCFTDRVRAERRHLSCKLAIMQNSAGQVRGRFDFADKALGKADPLDADNSGSRNAISWRAFRRHVNRTAPRRCYAVSGRSGARGVLQLRSALRACIEDC